MTKFLPSKVSKYVAVGSIVLVVSLLISSLYQLFFEDLSASHSVTQSWKSYYTADNWNLPTTIVFDFDSDGQTDSIDWNSCAFISSAQSANIPPEKQCQIYTQATGESMASNKIGQRIGSIDRPSSKLARKTFLVQTSDNLWRFYDMNGFQLRVYQLNTDNQFVQAEPTTADWIDVYTYQFSHLALSVATDIMVNVMLSTS
jgi:hypothetical protein